MKKNNNIPKCSECEYCDGARLCGNTRSRFKCVHPDHKYIWEYFTTHRIKKMPGFLGFGERFSSKVPLKTSPAWCPKRRSET